MIFKADTDKPHRCPACYTIPNAIWDNDGPMSWWRIYSCRWGHRFTRIPLLGRRLYGLIVETETHYLRLRWRGWTALLFGRGQRVSYSADCNHAAIRRYWVILTPKTGDRGKIPCPECSQVASRWQAVWDRARGLEVENREETDA